MSYTAWSVVDGETSTAAKLNQLGDNDAGFVDGTNFVDDIINARQLANTVMWEELGRDTLLSPKRYLNVSFSPKRFLKVLCALSMTSTGTWQNVFSFNGNAGANSYAYRYGDDNSSETVDANSTGFGVGGAGNNAGQRFCLMDILNERYSEKTLVLDTTYPLAGESGAAYPIHHNKQVAKWTDANDQINRIRCYAGLPSFDAGSEMIVLGHD